MNMSVGCSVQGSIWGSAPQGPPLTGPPSDLRSGIEDFLMILLRKILDILPAVAQIGIVEYGPENDIVLQAWRVYDIFPGFRPAIFFDQNFTSKMLVKQLSNERLTAV